MKNFTLLAAIVASVSSLSAFATPVVRGEVISTCEWMRDARGSAKYKVEFVRELDQSTTALVFGRNDAGEWLRNPAATLGCERILVRLPAVGVAQPIHNCTTSEDAAIPASLTSWVGVRGSHVELTVDGESIGAIGCKATR